MSTKFYTALDFSDPAKAWDMYQKIMPINPYFKVGLELYTAAGPAFIEKLTKDGARVFLDLKFHDIPNTVAGAICASVRPGIEWINIHISGGEAMVRSARKALDESGQKTKLLGVTVLTSLTNDDLAAVGVEQSVEMQVRELALRGLGWGLHGIVCSSLELPVIRRELPRDFVTMVPGIRPEGSAEGDQQRVATPKSAAAAGADFLVIGRPITQAADPAAAARAILADL